MLNNFKNVILFIHLYIFKYILFFKTIKTNLFPNAPVPQMCSKLKAPAIGERCGARSVGSWMYHAKRHRIIFQFVVYKLQTPTKGLSITLYLHFVFDINEKEAFKFRQIQRRFLQPPHSLSLTSHLHFPQLSTKSSPSLSLYCCFSLFCFFSLPLCNGSGGGDSRDSELDSVPQLWIRS